MTSIRDWGLNLLSLSYNQEHSLFIDPNVVHRPAFDVHPVEIQPHPGQATLFPGWWRVKLRISYDGRVRTFWRWHKAPHEKTPTADEILAWFWATTFADLHGFNFDENEEVPSRGISPIPPVWEKI